MFLPELWEVFERICLLPVLLREFKTESLVAWESFLHFEVIVVPLFYRNFAGLCFAILAEIDWDKRLDCL